MRKCRLFLRNVWFPKRLNWFQWRTSWLDVKLSVVGRSSTYRKPFVNSADTSEATGLQVQMKLSPCPSTSNWRGVTLKLNTLFGTGVEWSASRYGNLYHRENNLWHTGWNSGRTEVLDTLASQRAFGTWHRVIWQIRTFLRFWANCCLGPLTNQLHGQSPSWETCSSSVSHKIPRIL